MRGVGPEYPRATGVNPGRGPAGRHRVEHIARSDFATVVAAITGREVGLEHPDIHLLGGDIEKKIGVEDIRSLSAVLPYKPLYLLDKLVLIPAAERPNAPTISLRFSTLA